ncbi:MAG TPA: MraY family glycosyltransferase [Gemmatimonadales bacterium]|jgi:UDP-GlcNAc:undecaprenyl-phosphate GlcNAc-1-phosphate transferase
MRSYLFTFLLALLLGLGLTPLIARLGLRVGAVDRTKGLQIPRSGGVAILLATGLALLLLGLIWEPVRSLLRFSGSELAPVYAAAALIVVLGVVDDIVRLKAWPKLLIEVGIAVGLYYAGVKAGTVWLPFGILAMGRIASLVFTVAWIIGITNAFNLLDGIDGAAAGSGIFALLAMFGASVSLGQPLVALLAVTLAGATLGFLPFNFPPARIYLGDAGSLLLGFALATLALEGAVKGPAIVAIAIPIVAFGVPVLDTMIAVVRRGVRGAPIFKGDREHLHHRLLDIGLTNAQAAVILYAVSGAFALASMLFLNPNVRGMAVVLTMVGTIVWLAVRHLRLHEFFELARIAQRGMSSTRAISFNVQVRRAADQLAKAQTWDEIVDQLSRLFGASEFDVVRLIVQKSGPGSPRREYHLENGFIVERKRPIQPDEWGVHVPFAIGPDGARGELAVFRRYGRKPLLTDVNLLVEALRPSLSQAAGRVPAPPD